MRRLPSILICGDVGLDDSFALARRAVGGTRPRGRPAAAGWLGAGRGHRDRGLLNEFAAAGAESVELDGAVSDAMSKRPLVQRAVLECVEVSVDRGLRGGDLGGDGLQLLLPLVAVFSAACQLGVDGGVDDDFGAA